MVEIRRPAIHSYERSQSAKKLSKEQPSFSSEGIDAPQKSGESKPSIDKSVRKRRGRKRGARSVGRYPFLTKAKEYMEGRMLAETSREREARNIRMLSRMIVDLKKQGKMNETDPARFTKREVLVIEEAMRSKGLSGITIEKYRGIIESVCAYHGNAIYEEMKKKGAQFSMRVTKEVRSLSPEELEAIQEAANGIGGWTGEVCRFLTVMLPNTGLRPSELRLAELKDLNPDLIFIRVKNPKGKGKYGRERKAVILPAARPAIVRFLKARKAYLEKFGFGQDAAPLVPSVRGRTKPCIYSSNSFRRCKKLIDARLPAGFEQFSLKTFRATFLQIVMKDHPELLEDVSYSMGHSSTKTTQQYYRLIDEDKTVERIQQAFVESAPKINSAKNALIEKKFEVTGYA